MLKQTGRLYKILFEICGGKSKEDEKSALRQLIYDHEVSVKKNILTNNTNRSTYNEEKCIFFKHYNLTFVPPTSGIHRGEIRKELSDEDVINPLRESALDSWQKSEGRRAIMFGCKSTDYIKRSLENNPTTSVLVVDHSLKALSNASAVLFPEFGTRVAFLRSDPMFTCLHILPSESTDVAIVPMPTPFRSQSSSHRRLFTCDFVCALHLILKKRESVGDDRGFVTFTDSQPLASFMLEQLDESKLIVPWKQKNPSNTFSSWIPKQSVSDDDESEPQVVKNFPKQRFPDLIALAAAKPEMASKQAIDLIYSYDYKRRHYNPLDQYSEESDV